MRNRVKPFPLTFVLHCKRGYEDREASILEQMHQLGIPFEFFWDHDVPDLRKEEIDRFAPTLTKTSISVCLKHFGAMRKAVAASAAQVLVLEDDVFLFPQFVGRMKEIVEEAKALNQPYVIYLSNACHKYTPRSQRRVGQNLYESDHSRAADAYLISLEACQRRLEWIDKNLSPISLPIDHLYNQIDHAAGIKMYWAEDPIVEQGSMNGKFRSHLTNQRSQFVKGIRWKLDKLYKYHVLRNLR